ncbi:glycosyltransferase family 2 protein [Chitinophaga sp.]|uniref:glycosyltransferase family 2 protein n=1 Tax=Chitinophaga sp. TaxID=1869181 RepID=UPI0025BF8C9B|nr:glycosyltransferase family 2 protein [Chitinophaga sp.]
MQKDKYIPLVSIVTVNYNNAAVTAALLASVARNDYERVEMIVVDNASSENPTAQYAKDYPWVKVIRSETNLGFAGGNNLGMKAATGDYLFLVNNDTEFTPGLIPALLEVFQACPDAGIVSPKFHFFYEPGVIEYAGYNKVDVLTGRNSMIGRGQRDDGQYTELSNTWYAHGGAMMIKRSVLEEVGLMPDMYFLYYEELDWCEQFRKKGYQMYFQPAALIYHKESMSTGRNSPLKTYYLTRNRILFMRRNVKWHQLMLFAGYFTCITIPKNTLSFLFRRESEHLKAFWKGVSWHLKWQ